MTSAPIRVNPLVVIEDADIVIPNLHNLGYPVTQFPLDVPADEMIDYYQVRLEFKRFYGDAWPKWWPNFGPGIVAGFLGAQVISSEDTVWFACPGSQAGEPAEQIEIQKLRLAYNAENAWWKRVLELTRCAVERWGNRVSVAHTDLGGNLDILASLLGAESLLIALRKNPDEIAQLVSELTSLWLRYYNELDAIVQTTGRGTTPWATLWAPGRCYMLQSDLSCMISPKMFERFVLPDLAACCAALDYAFYHLDGPDAVRHLDMLLSLERLRGIQWIPGAGAPPPEEWLGLLERVRDAGKLCQLYVSPEGARTIVRELGGRGFAFYITEQMSQTEANDFIRLLASEEKR